MRSRTWTTPLSRGSHTSSATASRRSSELRDGRHLSHACLSRRTPAARAASGRTTIPLTFDSLRRLASASLTASPWSTSLPHRAQDHGSTGHLVVAAFDAGYVPDFINFQGMLKRSQLPHVIGLALTAAAYRLGAQEVPLSTITYSEAVETYIERHRKPFLNFNSMKWFALNRAKWLLLATVASKGFDPFELEIDVALISPLRLHLLGTSPAALRAAEEVEGATYDKWAFGQPWPAAPNGKPALDAPPGPISFDATVFKCGEFTSRSTFEQNMGLVLFQRTADSQRSTTIDFLQTTAMAMFVKSSWEQEEFNMEYYCRNCKAGEGPCRWPKQVHGGTSMMVRNCSSDRLRLRQLHICRNGRNEPWSDEKPIVAFAEAVVRLGSVHKAVHEFSVTRQRGRFGMHLIGNPSYMELGVSKHGWLRHAMLSDAFPERSSGRRGYVMLALPAPLRARYGADPHAWRTATPHAHITPAALQGGYARQQVACALQRFRLLRGGVARGVPWQLPPTRLSEWSPQPQPNRRPWCGRARTGSMLHQAGAQRATLHPFRSWSLLPHE